MSMSPDPQIANMVGSEALPRKNGELVFDALWEGRVFGMAVALNEQGLYPWREFRDQLAEEIKAADDTGAQSSYYERFLRSFEKLMLAKGFVSPEELDARTSEYASGDRDEDEHDHTH